MNQTNNTSEQKKKKAKGPIRFEAIVPFAVIVGLIALYFIVFFDGHLRRAIEFGATYANGAEVDVADVNTSFIRGDFEILGVEVTSLAEPSKNSVSIGRMHFKFLWDALLRMKFVIEDASISDLQVGTPRKRPGRITRKPDPEVETEKEEAKGNALADAAKLLEGALDLEGLKSIGNLESQAKIAQLQAELGNKEKEWKAAMANLPSGQDLQNLQSRIQNLRIGGTNNPAELQKQVQDADSLIKEANDKVNRVKTAGDTVKSGVNQFQNSIKELDEVVKKDIQGIESKLKLPRIDTENLSKQFFGEQFLSKLGQAKRYMLLARKYLPPKKSEDEKLEDKIEPPSRSAGKTFQFPVTTGYPLFWLKRAALSSQAKNSPFGGDVRGEILDVCSKPSQIGKPTILQMEGNFPGPGLEGVEARVTLDHTGDVPKQKLKAAIARFPVSEQMLSNTDSLKFGFGKAAGSTTIEGSVVGDELTFSADSKFTNIDYVVGAQSQQLDGLIKGAVSDIKQVTVNADARGTLSDLKFNIVSNLAAELQKGFERQLKAKLDEARAQIQKIVDEKIGSQKKALTDQYAGVQNQVNSQVAEKQKEADKLKGQAEAKLAEAKNQAENQGKKAVEDALKGKFKF
ncbi:MAG TPA: TIGR03545 family protein [Bdellovibrionales bacterium]|nr:TIGR03545 family protein [Bdellovibrionales bacterium]